MRTSPVLPLHRLAAANSLLAGILLLTQCQQNEVAPALPSESTTGANTAGCLVDGQLLVPRDTWNRSGTSLGFQLGTTAATASFSLSIVDLKDDSKPFIQLQADSLVLEEGKTHPFAFSPHKGVAQAMCATNEGLYYTTQPASGTLTITKLDRQANLLAGRFEFIATNKATGRQVSVTQGRFDYKQD